MGYTPIYQHLDTTGDGTGTINAIGDYSGAVTDFKFTYNVSNKTALIYRLLAYIRDGGTIRADSYGAIANGLTNGIQLAVLDENGDVKLDLTHTHPIKVNGDWAMHCYDMAEHTFGAGDNFVTARWLKEPSGPR